MKNIRSEIDCPGYIPREIQLKRMRKLIVQELTELQRYTLSAYYFQQMTMEQIARERGVSRSTVCRTLHRAVEKLKRFLKY